MLGKKLEHVILKVFSSRLQLAVRIAISISVIVRVYAGASMYPERLNALAMLKALSMIMCETLVVMLKYY